ncbi:MAG: MGH1-like glycoside hydrolase domain-containing protein, partial [Chloroflexota bacterium]
EVYFYLDNTPTHSYMKMLYKYPQAPFPYEDLVHENGRRGGDDFEYELWDTGVFDHDRYFDVLVEYAKAAPDDILIRISATNRGPDAAPLHLLPTLWFRNTWGWGYEAGPMDDVPHKPQLRAAGPQVVEAQHPVLGTYFLYADQEVPALFTENETNNARLFNAPNHGPYVKDALHRAVIEGEAEAVNPAQKGTKMAYHLALDVPAGETTVVRLRLSATSHEAPFANFPAQFKQRREEADDFYAAIHAEGVSQEQKQVQRQAWAGLLWTKQLYYFDVAQWLRGDPGQPAPPPERRHERNSDWTHLNNFDILSMPDKWEYPWYAAWDLAFHCIPLVRIDPQFAKEQLLLLCRVWYMHPNGQLPAYEWAFGDVNPPVHAWAAWRVYKIDAEQQGAPDRDFLERIFHKLLLNFTWWVNRKDVDGRNIFQGGFLGLDNISLFDRSAPLPTHGHLDQADGTAWMAFFCLNMLQIALELAREQPVYEDMATKFFEHFLAIARAMTNRGGQGVNLWNEEDGFFYDTLHLAGNTVLPLKVRSIVGLIPLLAVETLEPDLLELLPDFSRRLRWFTHHKAELAGNVASMDVPGVGRRRLLAILSRQRLLRVLRYLLNEEEFLAPYGIRSLSKYHQAHPYSLTIDGKSFHIDYQPAESRSALFGGNSNWRGPIWFPINYLLVEALQKFHDYYGDELQVEYPTGSGRKLSLEEVAADLSQRLIRLFLRDEQGHRPIYGGTGLFQEDPHWRDHLLFHEYFHGDNGAGLGASHQTGWTALVARLIRQSGGASGGESKEVQTE